VQYTTDDDDDPESDVISFPPACCIASSGRECAPSNARKSVPDWRIDPVRKLPVVCRLRSPDDRCPAFRTGPEAPGKVRRADTCVHTGCPDPSRAATAYDNNNNSNSNNIITNAHVTSLGAGKLVQGAPRRRRRPVRRHRVRLRMWRCFWPALILR